ncbi:hypothetical protein [Streptomyces fuscigenes]|nr:hypothetical protein [Streptomyces fuscigenes]
METAAPDRKHAGQPSDKPWNPPPAPPSPDGSGPSGGGDEASGN